MRSAARLTRALRASARAETVDPRSRLYVLRLLLERLPELNRKVLKCAQRCALNAPRACFAHSCTPAPAPSAPRRTHARWRAAPPCGAPQLRTD
jgi:hypothetical protein